MTINAKSVLEFVQQRSVGVLATVTLTGTPEAATIEYAMTNEFVLLFDTYGTYRKYENLLANPAIAFATGWNTVTLQFEGLATELRAEVDDHYRDEYLRRVPTAARFAQDPGIRWFQATPSLIRYRDYDADPTGIVELSFASGRLVGDLRRVQP